MEEYIEKILENQVIQTIVVIICSLLVYIFIKKVINKALSKTNLINGKKGKKATYAKLFTNVIKYIFVIVTALLVLQINGVDVSSMLAGLGIAGVISGLALQDALKDIIMGVNIITDEFFVVGDVVKYNDIEGKVISIGLKTTKIQDIYTNNIVSITNRNIEKIINVSKWLDIDVPISYNEKIDKIESILINAAKQIEENKKIHKCGYLGMNSFEDSSIIYKIRIYCLPENKPEIKREALRTIKMELNNNNVKIPYKQIDIHNKLLSEKLINTK